MIYYFAYASNMNHAHMKQLCPNSIFLKRVYCDGYKVVFDRVPDAGEEAVANIISAGDNRIWGGLYLIEGGDIPALDRYEDYPRLYEKKIVKVRDEAGFIFDALCYIRARSLRGIPSKEYISVILQGAYDCKLPDEYIQAAFRKHVIE